jgi:membrane protein
MSRPMATRAPSIRLGGARTTLFEVGRVFAKHGLLTYASAIAFRALVALVPLTLLGLAVLGPFGLRGVWTDTIAPAVRGHVALPVFEAVNYSVERILSTDPTGLVIFASVLVVWDMTWAVNAVTAALNVIHDVDEKRPVVRRICTAAGLGIAVAICLIASVLTLAVLPKLSGGVLDALLSILRWPVALAFLMLAVGLLMRYAPAEKPEVRWASGGSVLVIGCWIVASLLFRWWVTSVANFESAIGTLTVFLVLTSYVLVSSAIFLVGAQLDELARKKNARS